MIYALGETARLRARFSDETGAVGSGVAFQVWREDGTLLRPQVVDEGDGNFHADLLADQAGSWFVRATATMPQPAVVESGFTVTGLAAGTLPPDIGVTLTAEPVATSRRRRATIGQGIRLTARFVNRATGTVVAVVDPSITVQPPATSTGALPAPISFPVDQLTAGGTGVWRVDVAGDKAGTWWARAACSAPREATAELQFDVEASGVVPPSAASPMLVTDDLNPIVTQGGGVLTAVRVNALPDPGEIDGSERVLVTRDLGSYALPVDQLAERTAALVTADGIGAASAAALATEASARATGDAATLAAAAAAAPGLAPVQSVAGRSDAIILTAADVAGAATVASVADEAAARIAADALKAPLASPPR